MWLIGRKLYFATSKEDNLVMLWKFRKRLKLKDGSIAHDRNCKANIFLDIFKENLITIEEELTEKVLIASFTCIYLLKRTERIKSYHRSIWHMLYFNSDFDQIHVASSEIKDQSVRIPSFILVPLDTKFHCNPAVIELFMYFCSYVCNIDCKFKYS